MYIYIYICIYNHKTLISHHDNIQIVILKYNWLNATT